MLEPIPRICIYKNGQSKEQTNFDSKFLIKIIHELLNKMRIKNIPEYSIWINIIVAKSLNCTNAEWNVQIAGAHNFAFKIHSNISIIVNLSPPHQRFIILLAYESPELC